MNVNNKQFENKLTKICPICKKNSLYKVKNQRSDASFEYFVHCIDCHQWIGKIDWDGDFYILKQL